MKTYNIYSSENNTLIITIKGQKELIQYLNLPNIQYIKRYNIIHNKQTNIKTVKYKHAKSKDLLNRLLKYRIVEVQPTSKILKDIANNPPLLVKIFNIIFPCFKLY